MATAICLPPTGIAGNLTSWLLWNIWTSRNLLVFENKVVIAKVAVGKAILSAREWLAAQVTTPPPARITHPTETPPSLDTDVIWCNTDAAWAASNLRAGAGWSLTRVSSPLMAEALAMREAVLDAKRNCLSTVWFRTDSHELARALNSKSYPVELFGVLMDIESLSLSFSFFHVSFIGREHNTVADSLAKTTLYSSLPPLVPNSCV
ncbi:hypothetical protein Bca52824_087473 [Brassica carinata]|uniref:RNase H type-1 domain-containing protein n=1 Tax=Brassica carinata TaxID=52824 RepID=A0A8X7TMT6_BRACI|nr:hypothetical protein Bca52824_087473 [Brassica carinata]